jgi:hypothetical protein
LLFLKAFYVINDTFVFSIAIRYQLTTDTDIPSARNIENQAPIKAQTANIINLLSLFVDAFDEFLHLVLGILI